MGRKVSRAVVSGGVLYPAGATVPDEAAGAITADVWADAGKEQPERPEQPEPNRSSRKRKG